VLAKAKTSALHLFPFPQCSLNPVFGCLGFFFSLLFRTWRTLHWQEQSVFEAQRHFLFSRHQEWTIIPYNSLASVSFCTAKWNERKKRTKKNFLYSRKHYDRNEISDFKFALFA